MSRQGSRNCQAGAFTLHILASISRGLFWASHPRLNKQGFVLGKRMTDPRPRPRH